MSFLCAGRPLIECGLYVAHDGAYRARVEVDGTTEISGQVDLELPGVTYKCTVKRGGATGSRVLAVLSPGMGHGVPGNNESHLFAIGLESVNSSVDSFKLSGLGSYS